MPNTVERNSCQLFRPAVPRAKGFLNPFVPGDYSLWDINVGDSLQTVLEKGRDHLQNEMGWSVKEASYLYPHACIYVNGVFVPVDVWATFTVSFNDYVDVRVAPHGGGGGGSGRIVASIVVAIAAVAAAVYAPQLLPSLVGMIGSAATSAVVGMGVSLIGGLLVNQLFPVRPASIGVTAGGQSGTSLYMITGTQNTLPGIGDPIPQVIGRMQVYPIYATNPQTVIRNNHQYFRGVYVWSIGEGKVEDLKLGDTDISKFTGVSVNTYTWYPGDHLRLVSRPVREVSVSTELTYADSWVSRSTTECDYIGIDWVFAQGLFGVDNKGNMYGLSVEIEARFREIGTETWQNLFTAPFNVRLIFDAAPAFGEQVITYGPCGIDFPYQHRDRCYSITRAFETTYRTVYVNKGLDSVGVLTGSTIPPDTTPLYSIHTTGSVATVTKLNSLADNLTVSWVQVGDRGGLRFTVTGTIPTAQITSGVVSAATRDGIMRTVGRGVAKARYDVEVRRKTPDRTSLQQGDKVTWAALKYGTSGAVLRYNFPVTITELEIQGDNQLQGAVENLNGIYSSKMPVWDAATGTWERDYTSNCASGALEVLTGYANIKRRSWDEIDNHSYVDFWQTCEIEGLTYNKLHNQVSRVWDVVSDINAGGFAYPFVNRGVWGVTQDNIKTEIRQTISPHNSWGFTCVKTLPVVPHGFRVIFWNEEVNRIEEFRIYNDGYDEHNATEFEKVDFAGKTNYRENFIFGRVMFAAAQLRSETVQVSMDLEYLVLRRRDRANLIYDVMKIGFCSGRIREIHHPLMVGTDGTVILDDEGNPRYNTALITGVTVNNLCEMDNDSRAYGIAIRLHDGKTTFTRAVVFVPGGTYNLQFTDPVSALSGIREGMLFGFGELGRITSAWTVKDIETAADMTAVVSLIPYAPEIWSAVDGTIPPYNPDMSDVLPMGVATPKPPINVTMTETLLRQAGRATNKINISWQPPLSSDVTPASYTVSYRRQGDLTWTSANTTILNFNFFGWPEGDYDIQVVSVALYGTASTPTSITDTIIGLRQPCQNITGITLDSFSDQPILRWDANTDHTEYYEVRYTSVTDVTISHWESAIVLFPNIPWNAPYAVISLQKGTYMVRPFSVTGTTSPDVAKVRSGISATSLLTNVIETIDSDIHGGTRADTILYQYPTTGIWGLILDYVIDYDTQELVFAPVGYFYFDKIIELGGLFTVKVDWDMIYTSYSVNNDIFNVPDIFILPDIFNIDNTVYSVHLEYSYCEEETMTEWSAWKPAVLPTVTCYGIKFRAVLVSPNLNVTPFIQHLVIKIDVPDRLYRKENYAVGANAAGTVIEYVPPFMAKPYTGITIEDGQEGDDWTITEQTERSFRLFLFNMQDGASTPVSRVIDFFSSGYGYNLLADVPAIPLPPVDLPELPLPPFRTVYATFEERARDWPGSVNNGEVVENDLIGVPISPAWGGVYMPLVYTTHITVPDVPVGAQIAVSVFLNSGTVSSIEYSTTELLFPAMWGDQQMWGDHSMWNPPGTEQEGFHLISAPVPVTTGQEIGLRVTMVAAPVNIRDIHIVIGRN